MPNGDLLIAESGHPSRMVDRLVEAGLVTRRSATDDRRRVVLTLTAGGRRLVLRRPPGGELPPGAHDMSREHRILSRLWRVHPLAPESLHLCDDKSVIGVPFQLIDYRPGLVIKGDDRTRFAFERMTVRSRFGRRQFKVATDGEVNFLASPLTFRIAPHPLVLLRPADPGDDPG